MDNNGKMISFSTSAIFVGGMTAYFIKNLFIFDTPVSYLLFFVFLALLNFSQKNQTKSLNIKIPVIYIFISLTPAILIVLFVNISPLWASIKLRQNTTLFDISKRINVVGYKKAMRFFNPYKEEWRVDFSKSVIASLKTKKDSYNQEEMVYALQELKKNTAEHPNNTYYHMLLGIFYTELGTKDNKYFNYAKIELDRALELSPKRQHIYFAYGRLYELLKNKDGLIETFTKAIELEPNASISYWEGAKQMYLLDPENEFIDKWLRKAIELGYLTEDNEQFLYIFKKTHSYFLENKNYKILSGFYDRMQQIEPKEAKWHAQGATVNYYLGNYSKALENIKRAIELDESYRIEGEKFIKMIDSQ